MPKKRRRRYKLLQPVSVTPTVPARVRNATTLLHWASAGFLLGVVVAFGLVLTLFTRLRLAPQTWLWLWPASMRLMLSTGLTPHQTTHLAFWLAGENGLRYGAFGVAGGVAHVVLRMLFGRRRRA